tara:strand:+ start:62 stop:184 length:123 start_codon:yes stop_codon:yes gene_type:complete
MKRLLLALLLFSRPVLADLDEDSFWMGNINAVCVFTTMEI